MINIKKLKKLYKKKININQYLSKEKKINKTNIIKISYDIQTGSYINSYNIKNHTKY